MSGDSGTRIPKDLTRPAQWPDLELDPPPPDPDAEEEIPPDRPFIFLSYASEDRNRIAAFHAFLRDQGLPLWWDQDIPSGDRWRATIADRLATARVVLTFWTTSSVASDKVIEEAETAQARRALVHARLDDAALPYGFAETQYDDLRDWDGTASHPQMRKLIQKLQDAVAPPTADQMEARLIQASPVQLIPASGRLSLADTPINTAPAVQNPDDRAARLEGLAQSLDRLTAKISDRLAYQLPEEFRRCLSGIADTLQLEPLTWYALEDSKLALCDCLEDQDAEHTFSNVIYRDAQRIIARIDELRPLLQPRQVPLDRPGAKPPEPDPHIRTDQIAQVTALAHELRNEIDSEAAAEVLGDAARNAFDEQIGHIEEAATPAASDEGETRRMSRLRRALRGLAYLTGSTVAVVGSGVVVNLLTAPDAAVTLASRLKPIWDSILAFFL